MRQLMFAELQEHDVENSSDGTDLAFPDAAEVRGVGRVELPLALHGRQVGSHLILIHLVEGFVEFVPRTDEVGALVTP